MMNRENSKHPGTELGYTGSDTGAKSVALKQLEDLKDDVLEDVDVGQVTGVNGSALPASFVSDEAVMSDAVASAANGQAMLSTGTAESPAPQGREPRRQM